MLLQLCFYLKLCWWQKYLFLPFSIAVLPCISVNKIISSIWKKTKYVGMFYLDFFLNLNLHMFLQSLFQFFLVYFNKKRIQLVCMLNIYLKDKIHFLVLNFFFIVVINNYVLKITKKTFTHKCEELWLN